MSFTLLNKSIKQFHKRLIMIILFTMYRTTKNLCFLVLLLTLTFGCGIKRERPDEVKLIRNLISEFQKAVNRKDRSILDSLYYPDQLTREYSIPKLLQDFSDLGDLRNIRFTAKRIEIFKDSAAVNCTLLAEDVKTPQERVIKKPFEIHLLKKRKEWKIIRHKLK